MTDFVAGEDMIEIPASLLLPRGVHADDVDSDYLTVARDGAVVTVTLDLDGAGSGTDTQSMDLTFSDAALATTFVDMANDGYLDSFMIG